MNTRKSSVALPVAALVGLVAASAAAPAAAQPLRDQQEQARQEMATGNALARRDVERRVVPRYLRQGYEYLGFEYDDRVVAYRFKFIRDGRVMFVDVSARDGRVLKRSR